MLSQDATGAREWQFDDMVSAAGWVDREHLLIASETELFTFEIQTGARKTIVPLEADKPDTRSNDGRADPWGGFWIGTMGKRAQPGAGAIYRLARGALRQIVPGLTIPNAICFDKARGCAYYTDTPTGRVMRLALDAEGWPDGDPEIAVDLSRVGLHPDGAVTDAAGNLWIAQWGAARVACYSPEGAFLREVKVGGKHSSCPAFGGPDLTTLFVTTAREGLSGAQIAETPENGMVFAATGIATGRAEPRVIL